MRRPVLCGLFESFHFLWVVETEINFPRANMFLCQRIHLRSCIRSFCIRSFCIASAAPRRSMIARENFQEFSRRHGWTPPSFRVLHNGAVARDDGQAPRSRAGIDDPGDHGIGCTAASRIMKNNGTNIGGRSPASGTIADQTGCFPLKTTSSDQVGQTSLIESRNFGGQDAGDVQEIVDIDNQRHGR